MRSDINKKRTENNVVIVKGDKNFMKEEVVSNIKYQSDIRQVRKQLTESGYKWISPPHVYLIIDHLGCLCKRICESLCRAQILRKTKNIPVNAFLKNIHCDSSSKKNIK